MPIPTSCSPERARQPGGLVRGRLAVGLIWFGWVILGRSQPLRAQGPPPLDPLTSTADVHLVLDIRPPALLGNPAFQQQLSCYTAGNNNDPGIMAAVARGKIEQVLVLAVGERGKKPDFAADPRLVLVVRAVDPYNWTKYPTGRTEEVKGDGFTYRRGEPDWFTGGCFRILDDRTLMVGTEDQVIHPPIGAGEPAGTHDWDAAWSRLAGGPIRLALDATVPVQRIGPPERSRAARLFAPLLDRTRGYALTLNVADGLAADAVAIANDRFEAPRVRATIEAARTLVRNLLPDLRTPGERETPETTRARTTLAAALDPILDQATIELDGSTTRVHLQADQAFLANAFNFLTPALPQTAEEGWRLQSAENMKRIGQAMFAYENATGRPLNAVMYGRDGKTPHSWRVALLPYLGPGFGSVNLFTQYHFEEPWDGPNNRRLIDLMPRIYEDPIAEHTHLKASIPSYFVLTGPATLFPHRSAQDQPPPFLEGGYHPVNYSITDSSYQTIKLVEAKRDIPWTKPEDIPYARDEPLPEFGGFHPGGFNTLFVDGQVRFTRESISPKILRAMITAAGGEIIRGGED